ncbi:hypothetical protein ACFQ88_22650 [Paenibacillus sp. NPDC056579]|uniref:hypothetical protein n=1 Tax=Paenibacillus sp. NPDC056579 TaxID=3345871 RepID=UPI0036B61CE3
MRLKVDVHRELPAMAEKSNENINILLADRDQEWCCRFTGLLQTETDIRLINISTTKEEAVRATLQLDVDVVVVNALRMMA